MIRSLLTSPEIAGQLERKKSAWRADLCLLAALVIIVVNMAAVWIDAKASSYVPCIENCGETFHVLKYVRDYRLYGAKYGLIEDLSDDPSPSRTPILYTHNANLPGVTFALMEAAGIRTLAGKQFVTLLIHGLGLLYAFLAIRFLTNSAGITLIFCILFATEYELVFAFSLNALRAWHWLALFGLIFHVGSAVRKPELTAHVPAVAVFAAIAMGMGYDFYSICAVISALTALVFTAGEISRRRRLLIYVSLLTAFLVPIPIRQIQILSIMGFDYWRTDIYYSVVSKVPLIRGLVDLPPESEIASYYDSHGVFRPRPSSRSFGELLSYFGDLLRYVTLPLFGIVTLVVFAGMTASACVLLLKQTGGSTNDADAMHRQLALKAVFSLAVGSALGMLVLADHNLTIFIKHKVPLIAAPIFLAKAVAIAWLIEIFIKTSDVRRRAFAAVGFSLLFADHLAIQYFNYSARVPYRFTWIDHIRANPDATYAISWDPAAVSVFANTRVRSISLRDQLALEQFVTDRVRTNARPRIITPLLTDLPDYWLYFPTDGMSPFDSFSPSCRLDYVSTALLYVVAPDHPTFRAGSFWVRPSPALPGDYVAFGGSIDQAWFHDVQLETSAADRTGQVVFNCKYGKFNGWIRTSESQPEGEHVISVRPRSPNFAKVDIAYKVSAGAAPADFEHPALLLQLPMPSADDMRQRMASLPVAKSGPGWVLFDLRALRRGVSDQ